MTIIRGVLPSDNFTQLSNQWVRDARMSWKARGLLVWLASHSVGYQIDTAMIQNSGTDGEVSVRAGLRELVNLGYLTIERSRDSRGFYAETTYILRDPWAGPQPNPAPASPPPERPGNSDNAQVTSKTRFPTHGEPTHGEPTCGEPRIKEKTKNSKKTKDQRLKTPERFAPGQGPSSLVAEQPTLDGLIVDNPETIIEGKVAQPITAREIVAAYVDAYDAVHPGRKATRHRAVGNDGKRLLADGQDAAELIAAAELMGREGAPSLLYALDSLRRGGRRRPDRSQEVLARSLDRILSNEGNLFR